MQDAQGIDYDLHRGNLRKLTGIVCGDRIASCMQVLDFGKMIGASEIDVGISYFYTFRPPECNKVEIQALALAREIQDVRAQRAALQLQASALNKVACILLRLYCWVSL